MSTKYTVRWCRLLVMLLASPTGSALAQFCNWEANAEAEVSGGLGLVSSYHFGEITRVECINSRKVVLEARTTDRNAEVYSRKIVGGDADLGAWMSHGVSFAACSGAWKATTKFGTRFLGLDDWLDEDTSGILYPYCPPPDPPPPCKEGYEGTQTFVLQAGQPPTLSRRQPDLRLERWETRDEGAYLMDEWAIVAVQDGRASPRLASSGRIRTVIDGEALRSTLAEVTDGLALVVGAPDHAPNSRAIPLPRLLPFDARIEPLLRGEPDAEFWFRAEVSEAGIVDQVLILDGPGAGRRGLRAAVRNGLRLEYQDERRHRAVVFASAVTDAEGFVNLEETLVLLPQCCCDGRWCE